MKQPNSNYLIREMIKLGKFDEAMNAAKENEDHFEKLADEQRDLYHEAATGYVRSK
jgi:uncharacterized protein YdcH (DUF465 family)